MMKNLCHLFYCCLLASCQAQSPNILVNPQGKTIATRILLPKNYERIVEKVGSFGAYVRALPLKAHGSPVLYFDKREKNTPNVYIAVVDMEIDAVDLQQCADAVMRLRGEYLFQQKDYKNIHFNYVSDGKPRYFEDFAKGAYNYVTFRKYMRTIFAYANTASLFDELKPVSNIQDIATGDVFIQKGKPYGHAVIVVDVAIHQQTKQKIFLLAQSYMPAQETQILKNPINSVLSPWYEAKSGTIQTPEWKFESRNLRRF